MRLIEGTVDEIVEYQRRTDTVGSAGIAEVYGNGDIPEQEPVPARRTGALGDDEEGFFIRRFVYERARDGGTARRVLEYLERVLELGTYIEVGSSERTADGYTNYLMVRDDRPRRFGAVAYVRPGSGGLTLRLRPEDVEDIEDEHVFERDVAARQQYAIICPLSDSDAVELALTLTQRALAKVRPDEE